MLLQQNSVAVTEQGIIMNEIRKSSFTFPSSFETAPKAKGEHVIDCYAVQWMPPEDQTIRAIVQITHGMCEHIERYDHFARFLAKQGFVVCGQDNIGHGKSIASTDDWGHIPARGGKNALIENLHMLRTVMTERVAQCAGAQASSVPYIMFGHSMGSFILRDYLAKHGEGLAGAIICGTGHQSATVAMSGLAAAKMVARVKGERYVSDALFNLADGAYSKAIKGARTPLDWLSSNPAVVDAYQADPACGFRFSAGAYVVLTELLVDVSKKRVIERVPKTLPLYIIAGADDPVGDKGRGVLRVYQEYKQAGIQEVKVRLYLGARHEILNEVENEKVYNDILAWLKEHAL